MSMRTIVLQLLPVIFDEDPSCLYKTYEVFVHFMFKQHHARNSASICLPFLLHDSILAQYMLSFCVCPSQVGVLSNGDIADDLGYPLISQTTPISTCYIAFLIFIVGDHRDFIFGVHVVHSKSQHMND